MQISPMKYSSRLKNNAVPKCKGEKKKLCTNLTTFKRQLLPIKIPMLCNNRPHNLK